LLSFSQDFQAARQLTLAQIPSASKVRARRKGVWGEFRLASARGGQAILAKTRHPARSEQSPAKKFSFPFKRKRNRAPNQKMRRKLFCGTARETSGGGAERSKFAVRIFVKKSSDFVQQTPPNKSPSKGGQTSF